MWARPTGVPHFLSVFPALRAALLLWLGTHTGGRGESLSGWKNEEAHRATDGSSPAFPSLGPGVARCTEWQITTPFCAGRHCMAKKAQRLGAEKRERPLQWDKGRETKSYREKFSRHQHSSIEGAVLKLTSLMTGFATAVNCYLKCRTGIENRHSLFPACH